METMQSLLITCRTMIRGELQNVTSVHENFSSGMRDWQAQS
jgi:hypothetical protein